VFQLPKTAKEMMKTELYLKDCSAQRIARAPRRPQVMPDVKDSLCYPILSMNCRTNNFVTHGGTKGVCSLHLAFFSWKADGYDPALAQSVISANKRQGQVIGTLLHFGWKTRCWQYAGQKFAFLRFKSL
jgi:hypothetical protein